MNDVLAGAGATRGTAADYGSDLPDSIALINAHSAAIINLYFSIATFVSHRSSLEREYAKKLSESAGTARAKLAKSELQGTSLELAWRNVIETSDRESRQHAVLADALGQVVSGLEKGGARNEAIRKKHLAFAGELQAKRDKAYALQDKAKSKYYDSCTALSSARSRLTLATTNDSDARQADKASRLYEQATNDAALAKNDYLLQTTLANAITDRLYHRSLPSLQRDFQQLESSSTSELTHLLSRALDLARSMSNALLADLSAAFALLTAVSPLADQAMFVTRSRGADVRSTFALPAELVWEDSSIWHSDADYSLTSLSSSTYLQNLALQSSAARASLAPQIVRARKEMVGLEGLLEAYERGDRGLGDAGDVLEGLMEARRVLRGLEEADDEAGEREEVILAVLGGPIGPTKLHDFKSSSFVAPVSCRVCESNVWGRGMLCKACGCAVHIKCELHIPADCGLAKLSGVIRRDQTGSKSSSNNSSPSLSSTSAASFSNASSLSRPILAPRPVHSPPPSVGIDNVDLPQSSMSVMSIRDGAGGAELRKGTLAYDYAALSAFELTVSEGETVSIMEEEDQSGWVKVMKPSDRTQGLIPGSYLVGGGEADGQEREEEQERKRAKALYDYEATGDDEVSLVENDIVFLAGSESAEGWTEVIKSDDGGRGIVPSSYIEVMA